MKNEEILREMVLTMVEADDKQTGYQRCEYMLKAALRKLAEIGPGDDAGHELAVHSNRGTGFRAALRSLGGE